MTTQPTTTEAALEPCPFCGGKAILGMFNVWCANCQAQTRKDVDAEAAEIINKWNSRIRAPSVAPVVDEQWVSVLAGAISTAEPTLMPERDDATHYVIASEAFAGLVQVHRAIAKHLWGNPAPASTVAPQQSDWLLDCPMCNAPKSFAIDSSDDTVGFCLAERRNWRIIDTTCVTDGCFQPKATFGDLCMDCLAKAVDSQ